MRAVAVFAVVAALVVLAFVVIWLRDARRSRNEATDPDRLRQDPRQRSE